MIVEKQRSPSRIKQYAPYIRDAVEFCIRNGFYSESAKAVLTAHYEKSISTPCALRELSKISKLDDIESEISFLLYKPRLELHPINRCNYHCGYCGYYENYESADKQNSYIHFNMIDNIKIFSPKAVLLSGGYCEPSLYMDTEANANVNDLIKKISVIIPNAQIGMNTNGSVNVAEGFRRLSWLRISLDAEKNETLSLLKGTSITVNEILKNCRNYLRNARKEQSLGFGFLYHNKNIGEIVPFIELIYNYFKNENRFDAINIHFRPLRPLINERVDIAENKTYAWAYDETSMETVRSDIEYLVNSSTAVKAFIEKQTNVHEIYSRYINGNYTFEDYHFPEHCFLPFVTMIVGPSGCCYACLTAVEIGKSKPEERMIIGNFNKLEDRKEQDRLILNTIYASCKIMTYCNKYECNQGALLDYHKEIFSNKEEKNIYDSYFF